MISLCNCVNKSDYFLKKVKKAKNHVIAAFLQTVYFLCLKNEGDLVKKSAVVNSLARPLFLLVSKCSWVLDVDFK